MTTLVTNNINTVNRVKSDTDGGSGLPQGLGLMTVQITTDELESLLKMLLNIESLNNIHNFHDFCL